MEKHDAPQTPPDDGLPRPVVLRPEDLASVAAAGILTAAPTVAGRILIAGGITPGGLYTT